MIKHINGDLLETNVDIMAHQVNCMSVMGAGIAKQIRNKYPNVYKEYCEFCNMYPKKKDLLGECLISEIDDDKFVANLFGELDFKPRGIRHTDYDALEQSLNFLKFWCDGNKIKTIGVPDHIGCGLAGGDWDNVVYPMLKDMFEKDENITLYIVKYNG